MTNINDMRRDYSGKHLIKQNCPNNPIELFEHWFNHVSKDMTDANGMVLSTVDKNNRPHSRVVLLKFFDHNGFGFFTNYDSHKGEQIAHNPFAALNFWWPKTDQQIRIEGTISKLDDEHADQYFSTRPKGSQIAAIVSPQSQPIESHDKLIKQYETYEHAHGKDTIVRPKNWGGYVLKHDKIEFWQGRPNRLHDRILYTYDGTKWVLERLCP